jgi:hypothetical protein
MVSILLFNISIDSTSITLLFYHLVTIHFNIELKIVGSATLSGIDCSNLYTRDDRVAFTRDAVKPNVCAGSVDNVTALNKEPIAALEAPLIFGAFCLSIMQFYMGGGG